MVNYEFPMVHCRGIKNEGKLMVGEGRIRFILFGDGSPSLICSFLGEQQGMGFLFYDLIVA